METVKAIIVDDELNARENLNYLLQEFCKEVQIVDEASNVDEAIVKINKHKPNLVFLDIEMPQKNGFQLLEEYTNINFQVIFITAYDKYAIQAFEVAAVDYLLKPIEISRLKQAVNKVVKAIESVSNTKRIDLLKTNKKVIKRIAIPYKSDYAIVNIEDISCIEADRMYSIIHTTNSKKFIVAKKLNHYEDLLCEKADFIRVHRSWIINANKIETYSKKEKHVVLTTSFKVSVSKSYKENFEAFFYS